MVGKSDFVPFSALNFCKDNAFFRYKETNGKTLIKKGDFWVRFCKSFNDIYERCCRVFHLLLCCDYTADYFSKIEYEVTYTDCWRKEKSVG